MLTALGSKMCVECNDLENNYYCSIEAAIATSVANKMYHCEWYTPAGHDCNDEDLEVLNKIIHVLINNGYAIRSTVFESDEVFPNKRIKLKVEWK